MVNAKGQHNVCASDCCDFVHRLTGFLGVAVLADLASMNSTQALQQVKRHKKVL